MTGSVGQAAHIPLSSIRLLGPVDVTSEGRSLALGRRARTMVAVLAVRAGQVIPADVLIDAMWDDDQPRSGRHAVQVHVSRLRARLVGGPSIHGDERGYLLRVGPGQLDVDRFEELAGRGRAELGSGRPEAAADRLGEALALWRGDALADVPWERFAESEVHRWRELRYAAEEDLVDAQLAAGRQLDLVSDIDALVREQPYRERRWGQLMIALYRAGRQAEALARYREVRALLAAEFGIDPSPRLRELEVMVLHQDNALGATPASGDLPVTRFAPGPAGRLAYQVLGDDPASLVLIPGFGGNVELRWEDPTLSRFYRRLARRVRLVLMDKRGTGLSDRDTGIPPIEDEVDDVLAVMDAVGIERAALLGVLDGGAIGLLTAAAHPERVSSVITYACFPCFAGLGERAGGTFAALRESLDRGVVFDDALPTLAPSRADDPAFGRWLGRYLRMATGVGGAAAMLDRCQRLDIRSALADVSAPVLALNREHDRLVSNANAHAIAAGVQNGRSVILPGTDSLLWASGVEELATHVTDFLKSCTN